MDPLPAATIAALPHWLQVTLLVLGAIVPTFSHVSSVLNRYVGTFSPRSVAVRT